MTTATLPRPKLALLIPRLASEHDGEVVATARAIGRTLRAGGADWHDLAAAVEHEPVSPVVFREKPAASPPTWATLDHAGRLAWLDRVRTSDWASDWERDFTGDIWATIYRAPQKVLTPKQRWMLDRLLVRAFAHGAAA